MRDAQEDKRSARTSGTDKDERAERRLPLGGSAFVSPLAWAPSAEKRWNKHYWIAAIALCSAALLSAGIVAVALYAHDQWAGTGSAPRVELRAEPPSEARRSSAQSRMAKRVATKRATVAKATGSVAVQPTVQALPVAAVKREPANRKPRAQPTVRAAPPPPALPSELSRAQVIAAMRKITPAVTACFGNTIGKATVTFSVVGKTGRIVGARVTGQNGKVGSCIARAVRRASFPKFAGSRLKVSYPFAR